MVSMNGRLSCCCLISLALLACSSKTSSKPDSGGMDPSVGGTAAGGTSAGNTAGAGGSSTATGGAAGSGSGGNADAGSRDASQDGNPPGACGAGGSADEGWVEIQAAVSGLGKGLMTSPILRCERDGGRLAVLAAGTEQDEVDYAVMRIVIPQGFTGPGVYTTEGQAVAVDVYHDDVTGFSTTSSSRCQVCVGSDGQSGSFTCTGLSEWGGSRTMDVTSGAFTCPTDSTVTPTTMGGSCTLYTFSGQSSSSSQANAVPQPRCADGVCVTASSISSAGICSRACGSGDCPSGYRCDTVIGQPTRVCVNAAVCGNGIVEMGETCDAPVPTDHCADACVRCKPRSRPGWVKMDLQAGDLQMSVDAFPPTADCTLMVGSYKNQLSISIESCDSAQKFALFGVLSTAVGTSALGGGTSLCISKPGIMDESADRVVYCAMLADPPSPGESGSVTVTDALCDKGYGPTGIRGSLKAHMVYQYTEQAHTDKQLQDPVHVGETLDVTATFELVANSL
jgi:hypothetical protein